jgi:signal transduction histidine kinase
LLRREASLERLTRDLGHLREMRRKDEQLVRAEKLATAGVLMSGLAHEIGTPLGVLSMRLQLLRRRFEEGSEETKTVDILLSQLERVTGLIRQLLDFARAKPMPESAVDVRQILSTVESLLTPMAQRKKSRLQIDAPEGLPPASGNGNGLQQVFLNLVINALQAIDHEDGLVRLTARAEGSLVRVRVEDNGPGIPEDRRNAIFDPFFTTKKQGEGSGLGLTVVLDLVRRMGGDLRVGASSDFGGARFDVELRRWDGTTAIQHD